MSTKPPTKTDHRRWQDMQEIGCIACYQLGFQGVPSDMHHLLSGYRIGHYATIALCPWHHRGVPEGNLAPSRMEWLKGPSLAIDKRAFHAHFGTEEDLLAAQETRLADYRQRIIGRSQ